MKASRATLDFSLLSRDEIAVLLAHYGIALSPDEALRIQHEILRRPPTLTECVLWSIQGSEHSSYKSSKIHLGQLPTDGPNVILGPKEDAGIVAVATDQQGRRYGIVVSHESHNHPSQIVPYEGAATGVGGNVRDVACMGARVVALADGLRFGDLRLPNTLWIHDGVVSGIAGYGNPIGVPVIAGDLYYDEGYNDNCLVTVVTLGIVREDEVIHSSAPDGSDGYDLILVGKATDNSGFGGASFASLELEEEKRQQNQGAVQEPNAFLERHLLKATYALVDQLRSEGATGKVGFKDLGAGGIACASVELADSAGLGADLFLDRVHTSMPHLHPSVVLCSETQERFLWVSPPAWAARILKHYNTVFALPHVSEGAEARIIGRIRKDGRFRVHTNGETVVDAPARQVTQGFLYSRPHERPGESGAEPDLPEPADYNAVLLRLLSHENIASRLPVFETYDKNVQGRTALEPGDGDAGVIAPFNDDSFPEEIRRVGVALSVDQNPRYGKISPYWGAVNAVVEAVRNVAAVGASPQAITDCLCFGSPEKPQQMGQFVEAVRGIADACRGIRLKEHPTEPLPVVSGNVSFYNESKMGAIPPSPMISCLGRIDDAEKAVPMHFPRAGLHIFLLGERRDECGGSIYYALFKELGANVPKPDLAEVGRQVAAVTDLAAAGIIEACHDISDGGIAVALAEMSFRGSIGCRVSVPGNFRTDKLLLSETGGFVLALAPEARDRARAIAEARGEILHPIGETTAEPVLEMNATVRLAVSIAREAWSEGLRNKL